MAGAIWPHLLLGVSSSCGTWRLPQGCFRHLLDTPSEPYCRACRPSLPLPLQDMEVAQGCFRHLRLLFQELEETRPFELLKGQVGSRSGYKMRTIRGCSHAC